MTVKELIDELKKQPPDEIVYIWAHDYTHSMTNECVSLQVNDMQELMIV